MAINSNGLSLNKNSIASGSAVLDTLRGSDTWGANYVFHSGGLQQDIRAVADAMYEGIGLVKATTSVTTPAVLPTVSGVGSVGSANYPYPSSGFYMKSADGSIYRLFVTNDGEVSGTISA